MLNFHKCNFNFWEKKFPQLFTFEFRELAPTFQVSKTFCEESLSLILNEGSLIFEARTV